MLFRYRLKALREDADLTQQELADKLHITRPAISNYENTNREPSYDVLIKIADYFNISLDYLLCRTNARVPFSELYKDLKTK